MSCEKVGGEVMNNVFPWGEIRFFMKRARVGYLR
jgi:hypothetical protein